MDKQSSVSYVERQRQLKWIKWFMRTYWTVIFVHFAAQWFSYLFLPYPMDAYEFYIQVLFIPTLLMSVITLLAQYIQRRIEKSSYISLFVAGTMIAMIIIHLNIDIRIISAIMLLPIVASAIFFRISLTMWTAVMQIIGFAILYQFDSQFRFFMNPFDLVAIPIFIAIGTLVAGIIILSGRELSDDLKSTMTAKQTLIAENALMMQQSKTDSLTQLFNHMSFHQYYDKALEYASKGAPFHLALLDIDNFKGINDNYGHRVGDIVLARVAGTISSNLSPDDIAARYGGEEFAILLFEKSFTEAFKLVESIRRELAVTRHEELDNQAITISIGLKSCSPGDTKESLFEEVDSYLYTAKRTGKNRTVTAKEAHSEASPARETVSK